MTTLNFDGYKVLDQIIKDRGQTHVFFINGVLVPDFISQKNAVGDALNINNLPSSMKLDGAQNPSALPSMTEVLTIFASHIAAGLIAGGIGVVPLTLQAVGSVIKKAVIGVAIDTGEALWQIYTDDLTVSNWVNQSWTGADKVGDWLSPTSNDSVIFIPHSQGNLFVEDGLRVINPDTSRVRIISLGSPTDYSSSGGMADIIQGHIGSGAGWYQGANIKNIDDPITYFQGHSDGIEAQIKDNSVTDILSDILSLALGGLTGVTLEKLFDFLLEESLLEDLVSPLVPYIKSNFPREYQLLAGIGGTLNQPLELVDGHNLETRYLKDDNGFKSSFKTFAYQLQPQGYYFPNPKIQGIGNISGTEDDDWIEGTSGNDLISGRGRNDFLRGEQGNDYLSGGSGYDLLDGGDGNEDTADYYSSPGRIKVDAVNYAGFDVYKIEDGFGTVDTVGNVEIIIATIHDDIMNGGDYGDIFIGEGGSDILHGNGGNDRLEGGDGVDFLYGGADTDVLRGDADNDFLFGGDGIDFLNGGTGDDYLDGGSEGDFLEGDEDNDILHGRTGDDTLEGGSGNDQLYAEEDNDFLFGGTGDDYLDGGSGNDHLYGEADSDTLKGGTGNDLLDGGSENDHLYGEADSDTLKGGTGNDLLDGGSENDHLYGEADSDTLKG
ncbi:calcium-binding protein, partial [Coleofasciculus sp. H7-2]|uniref:calcium-binding protein n=1 Tax=Coleofasciculus sp. H7-2 TaxID=3351545 RepID=UPI003671A722